MHLISWPAFFATICLTSLLAAETPAKFNVAGLEFTRPSGWKWIEVSSPMRKAQLEVGEGKDKAEIVFFHFGEGQGGDVKANIERWFSQFQDAKNKATEEASVNGRKITYAFTEGTYLSGMPGAARTPLPDHALAGAILENPQGSVFVKMTGPKETVHKAIKDFKRMVQGAVK